tara:strand:- start:23 stop:175 length:153 start_codon:yes stop_codon:yes gene_type:complete
MINWLMLKLYKMAAKAATYCPEDAEEFKKIQGQLQEMRDTLDKRGIKYND